MQRSIEFWARPRALTGTAARRGAAAAVVALTAAACQPQLVVGAFGDPAVVADPPATAAPAEVQGCWAGTYAAPYYARRGRLAVLFAAGRPAATNEQAPGNGPADGVVGWLAFDTTPARGPVPVSGQPVAAAPMCPAGERAPFAYCRRAPTVFRTKALMGPLIDR